MRDIINIAARRNPYVQLILCPAKVQGEGAAESIVQGIRMLEERNIRVPEDVSVISIDDSDLARHSEVPITSLPHPKENLGKKAAETLLQMIAGKKKDLTYEFDTRVVERESVAEHKSL